MPGTSKGSFAGPTMLWPFNYFRKPRIAPHRTIEAIYGTIVTQAREPLFYRDLGVPDTVDGRFDLLLLHLWLALRRLRATDAASALSQALFDRFCNDMDDNLREMGGRRPDRTRTHEGLRGGLLWPRSSL
jgi:cytochrome b pre-mRNA-processing protein 3